MTKWRLRCTECGREWVLAVSFDLASMGKIYHYCPYCKRNTFHIVLGTVDSNDDSSDSPRVEEAPRLLEEGRDG